MKSVSLKDRLTKHRHSSNGPWGAHFPLLSWPVRLAQRTKVRANFERQADQSTSFLTTFREANVSLGELNRGGLREAKHVPHQGQKYEARTSRPLPPP